MNNKNYTLIAVVTVILLVVAGLVFFNRNAQVSPTAVQTVTEATMDPMLGDPMASQTATNTATASATATKQFTVEGSNFKFAPTQLRVNTGDTVQITFKNAGGFHDFVIDEFNVSTKQIGAGSQEVVTFVANKPGTYEFYCSVGNHRAMGMKGTLVVE